MVQTAAQFLPIVFTSIIFGIIPYYLGVKKGYTWPFLVLAWVLVINMFSIALFVGLPDKNLHRKMDQLLERTKGTN